MVLGPENCAWYCTDDRAVVREERLNQALMDDDAKLFVELVNRFDSISFRQRGQEFLMKACMYVSFKCASALLNGQTPLVLDINRPTPLGRFPIHHAAETCRAGLIELLLFHGAQTDVRCKSFFCDRESCLPLHESLCKASRGRGLYKWIRGESIYKLITYVCLPGHQEILESVELLAWNTNEIDDEFLLYAREGELSLLATLLAVAWKRLTNPIHAIRESFVFRGNKLVIPEDNKEVLLLLDVFERAGDALETYMKQNRKGETMVQTSEEVAHFLRGAGFRVNVADTKLSASYCFPPGSMSITGSLEDEDVGMAHYGKSGHRWMIYSKPIKRCEKLSEEDDWAFAIEERLDQAILDDNVKLVVKIVKQFDCVSFRHRGQEFLMKACKYVSFKCASALLNGQTPLIFDINQPTPEGRFPIHHAAAICRADLIELLLYHGARTDVRCKSSWDYHESCLPLYEALHKASRGRGIFTWTAGDSIFKLITFICLFIHQELLESVELLAWNTNEVEDEFLLYARKGELSPLASLLAVARKRLTHPIHAIRKSLVSHGSKLVIPEDKKEEVLLLLDVFERAGDALETYMKQNRKGETMEQTSEEVARLLRDAGFPVNAVDTVLSASDSFPRGSKSLSAVMHLENEDEFGDEDVGMAHYGRSGHRWMVSNKPMKRYGELSDEDDRVLAMEKRLDLALLHDDVTFVVKVTRKFDCIFFRLRGQEFLMKACKYVSFSCASALLNGQTTLILDINRPTPEGRFPIHHAAESCRAGLIELLLYHGARADVRCTSGVGDRQSCLPLYESLRALSHGKGLYKWIPGDSIFKLVTFICLQSHQEILESVELLAWNTSEIDDEFLLYARGGELSLLAPLLAVARKRLTHPILVLRKSFVSHNSNLVISEDKKEVLLLLDVFDRAGDALETYIKQNRKGETMEQTSKEVARLLMNAGFPVDANDTDLSSSYCFSPGSKNLSTTGSFEGVGDDEDEDVGMAHYGKSGHRWMIYNKNSNIHENFLKEPNQPFRRHEITEQDKDLIPTAVDKVVAVPTPCFSSCRYRACVLNEVEPNDRSSEMFFSSPAGLVEQMDMPGGISPSFKVNSFAKADKAGGLRLFHSSQDVMAAQVKRKPSGGRFYHSSQAVMAIQVEHKPYGMRMFSSSKGGAAAQAKGNWSGSRFFCISGAQSVVRANEISNFAFRCFSL